MNKVFVSSTSQDLLAYREKVLEALQELQSTHSIAMEAFGALPGTPLDECRRKVEACDLFVGIYGFRYGFIPEGCRKSLTELEYDWAVAGGKPIFCFVAREAGAQEAFLEDPAYRHMLAGREEGEAAQKLQAFKRRIDLAHVRETFTTPEHLARKVVTALANYLGGVSAATLPISALIDRLPPAADPPLLRLLLATSEPTPSGTGHLLEVNGQAKVVRECLSKLAASRSLQDRLAVALYELEGPGQVRRRPLDASPARAPETPEPDGLHDAGRDPAAFDLVVVILWHNLGPQDAVRWLCRRLLDTPRQAAPPVLMYRRSDEPAGSVSGLGNILLRLKQLDEQLLDWSSERPGAVRAFTVETFDDRLLLDLRDFLIDYAGRLAARRPAAEAGGGGRRADAFNPYKGLSAYKTEDGPLYYGRTDMVEALRGRVKSTLSADDSLLAVVGPSGAGKSSLVRAGLFWGLEQNSIPGSDAWLTIDYRISLAGSRHPLINFFSQEPTRDLPGDLYERLLAWVDDEAPAERPDLVAAWVEALLQKRPDDARLVVYVDQYEEVFSLVKDEAERRKFIAFLVQAARAARTLVIVSLRSDYLPRCEDYPALDALLQSGIFKLSPPDRAHLYSVIVGPAQSEGYLFEPGLAEAILDDCGLGSLPLLSFVLEKLVDRCRGRVLTHQAYEELGRVGGVIQQQADQAMATLDAEARRHAFNRVFRELIKVDEDGIATKQPGLYDPESLPADAGRLLERLVNYRLLNAYGPADEDGWHAAEPPGPGAREGQARGRRARYEIAHEAVLRHWSLLRDWIEETQEALVQVRRARREAQEWQASRRKVEEQARDPDAIKAARLAVDRAHLWPHERLQPAHEAMRLLGYEWTQLEEPLRSFIRPEQERLIDELAYDLDLITHQRRQEIGRRLQRIGRRVLPTPDGAEQIIEGDPRPGVGVVGGLPEIVWCRVPGGKVALEGHPGTFEVRPFYIAAYPVTLAQFLTFADPDGPDAPYRRPDWWEGLPGGDDPAVHHRPYRQPREDMLNCPAEWVSWYQAVAFCRWLSVRLGYTVRLPAEWEWQQAACGGFDHYVYPWGPTWDARRLSSKQGLSQLVAVGLYPEGASPVGALDMCGNVYEWCINAYEDVESTTAGDGRRRTTRGGAWFAFQEGDRSYRVCHRNADPPDGINERGDRIRAGFRLACDAPPPGVAVEERGDEEGVL